MKLQDVMDITSNVSKWRAYLSSFDFAFQSWTINFRWTSLLSFLVINESGLTDDQNKVFWIDCQHTVFGRRNYRPSQHSLVLHGSNGGFAWQCPSNRKELRVYSFLKFLLGIGNYTYYLPLHQTLKVFIPTHLFCSGLYLEILLQKKSWPVSQIKDSQIKNPVVIFPFYRYSVSETFNADYTIGIRPVLILPRHSLGM